MNFKTKFSRIFTVCFLAGLLLFTSCAIPHKTLPEALNQNLQLIQQLDYLQLHEEYKLLESMIIDGNDPEVYVDAKMLQYNLEKDDIQIAKPDLIFEQLVAENIFSKDQIKHLSEFVIQLDEVDSNDKFLVLTSIIKQDITDNKILNELEQSSLLHFFTMMEQTLLEDDSIVLRNQCTDCITKNRWSILGWGSIGALGAILLCMLFTGGGGSIGCLIAGGLLGYIMQICNYCYSECDEICIL